VAHALPAALSRRRPLPASLTSAGARSLAGTLALGGLVGTGFLLAAGVAAEPTSFVPARKGGFPGWLQGPLGVLDLGVSARGVVLLLGAMWAFYALALVLSDAIPAHRAVVAIVSLHLIFLLGPPLLSTDVFNYVSYGRLGLLHGLNPYSHAPAAIPGDPAYPFIGWRDATSVYGPFFTLATYGTAPLGVGGALWMLKVMTVGASLGCVALVWKGARLLGRSPVEAAMFFGLNPLLVVYAVGGVHNDLVMLALALGGIVLVLGGREASGGLAAVAGAAVKSSSALLLPFLVLGSRGRWSGRRVALGAAAGAALAAALWIAAFDAQVLPFLRTLRWEQEFGSLHSVPKALGGLVGIDVTNHWLRLAAAALFAGALVACLVWARRSRDWLTPAGWATVALLVTSTWLLPWYVIWVLPLAALSPDRKLRLATFALSAFVLGMRVPLWLG
jgi:alpha-1,6-mannosyltransferase